LLFEPDVFSMLNDLEAITLWILAHYSPFIKAISFYNLFVIKDQNLTSLYNALVSVDQILRIISFELSEILLDLSGSVKAECSAFREIYNHFKAIRKR
jgi:hypothetical protein